MNRKEHDLGQLTDSHSTLSIDYEEQDFHESAANSTAIQLILNHVEIGLCLIDATLNIHFSNEEANRIFRSNSGITIDSKQRLLCKKHLEHARFKQHLERCLHKEPSVNTTADSAVSISSDLHASPYLVLIARLPDNLNFGSHASKLALVTIVDLNRENYLQLEHLATAFQLTGAETETCKYLAYGQSNTDIAKERNVSVETVKSQVSSILRKTNMTRRSDIISLVLKMSPPIKNYYSHYKPFSGNRIIG